MGEPESMEQNPLLQNARPAPPKYYSYDFLIRQSKRLGRAATAGFFRLRDFLTQDIATPSGLHTNWRQTMEHQELLHSQPLERAASLRATVKHSQEVLARVKTVFPLTLFPDMVVLDRSKLTITQRSFFWSQNVMSIGVEDILNVSATTGPFFGSLKIAIRVMNSTDHFDINYFWRKDAIFLKHVIQGYLIARRNKIDMSSAQSKEDFVKTLCDLGNDDHR